MSIKFRIYFWLLWTISGSLAAMLGGEFQETWHQWRGPARDGQYLGNSWTDDLKLSQLKLDWSHELKSSYSSPVADLKTIYTSESLDGDVESVSAFDRTTGEKKWSSSWDGGMKVPFFARANGSWIRSTPVIHDGHLYILGMQERLVCIRTSDGEIQWELDVPSKLGTPEPSFGGVSSPVIFNNHLFVQAGGGTIKVDAKTGRLIWSSSVSADAMNESPFASPRIHTFEGVDQLISLGRTALMGIDPQDGKVLWQQPVPAFRGMNILTPTFTKDGILTATYGGKAHLFSPSNKSNQEWEISEKWIQKFQGYMSSPVIIDNFAYLHGRSGRMVCIDTQSGNIQWTSTESLGKYCSMVTNGKQILALSSDGKLRRLAADHEKYNVLETTKISDEETWAHIGLADDQVFIRALNSLDVFRWQNSPESEQVSTVKTENDPKLLSRF